MVPRELFGIGIRLVGLAATVKSLPEMLALDYLGSVPGIAGLVLLTRADLIARFCYPLDPRDQDWRVKVPKDFRDT